jgi:hypothetical protein
MKNVKKESKNFKKESQNFTLSGSLAEASDKNLPHGFDRADNPGISLAQR